MTEYWNIHMVSGENREYDDLNAYSGFISMYWTEIGDLFDYLNLNVDDFNDKVAQKLRNAHPEYNERQISQFVGSIRRFAYEMKIGDVVISPGYNETCFLGFIQSNYLFAYNNHFRKVKWRPISRKDLSEELKASMGTELTVIRLNHHREELARLLIKYGC